MYALAAVIPLWPYVFLGVGTALMVSLAATALALFALGVVKGRVAGSDLVLYPVLIAAIVFGMLATVWGSAADRYAYRETVSPWFRGLVALDPHAALMTGAPFLFQAHAVTAWLLFAIWPFTRLVHVWSAPLAYVGRAPVLLSQPRRDH